MSIIIFHLWMKHVKLLVKVTLHVQIRRSLGVNILCWMSRNIDDCLQHGNKQRPPKKDKQRLFIQSLL